MVPESEYIRRTDEPNKHRGPCWYCGVEVNVGCGVLIVARETGREDRWRPMRQNRDRERLMVAHHTAPDGGCDTYREPATIA